MITESAKTLIELNQTCWPRLRMVSEVGFLPAETQTRAA